MRKRPIALTLVVALLAAVLFPVSIAAQQPSRGVLSVPIATGDFTGMLNITEFARVENQIVAIGTVVGTRSTVPGRIGVQQVVVPISSMSSGGPAGAAAGGAAIAQVACDILTLVLGPLHLDLLGLVVDLNQVVLEITAEPGAGNLLGNLLCAVAGLLDPGGTLENLVRGVLNQIVTLLNRILGAL
jgi:hypothetical protein